MSHFTYFPVSFLTVLSILSRYDTKISRFFSLQRKTKTENCQAAMNGPNTFWPNEKVVLTLK